MGGKSSTTTTTNTPPPEVMEQYKKLLAMANPVAATPYQAYTGGVNGSGFEQNQLSGFQNIADLAGASSGNFGAAAGALGAAGVPTSASVGQYMSPYISDVANSTIANMNEMNGQQQQGVIGNAIAKGAMGGNRVGVAQAELARQQNLANQSTIANLYNTGYGTALSAAQADKAANLQRAQGYSDLGQTAMQTNLAQAAAQVGAGTQQQQFAYQQYQNALSYPFQTLGWLANISEGLGAGMGGTQTTTAPAGNTGAGILGGLLSLPWASGGVVHADGIPHRAQGGVIPYSGSSGIISMNDNLRPSANDNGSYVPDAATGTTGRSTMPQGGGTSPAPAQQQSNGLGSLFSGVGDELSKKYPNGILAGASPVKLPDTAPIPTPNPLTGEAGLPAKIGDVSSGGILSSLGSILGFAEGGVVARRGYDDGGVINPLLDGIRELLGSNQQPQPLADADFNARAGVIPSQQAPKPLPVSGPVAPSGVVPAQSGGVLAPPLPTRTVEDRPIAPSVKEYDAGRASQFSPMLNEINDAAGLPPGYLNQAAYLESTYDPTADNGTAKGLFQFTGPTAQQYGLSNPFDPVASAKAAARLAGDNGKFLAGGLGRQPTAGELYLAHQQGASGALNLLTHPDAPASDIVGRQAVIQNGGSPDMTAGQFAGLWTDRFNPVSPNSSTDSTVLRTAGVIPNTDNMSTGSTNGTGVIQPFSNGATPDTDAQGRPYTSGILSALSGLLHGQMPNLSPDARQALMSAGFGMMASRSPNFLTAVGEGGQQGVKMYQERQQQARENALAQSQIGYQQGSLGLEGRRVDIEGQQLALDAKKTAASIAQTTAETARTNLETQAGRYQRAIGPNGIMVTDVTKPYDTPRLITWSDLQNGAQLPGDGSSAPPSDQGSSAPVKAAPIAPVGPMPAPAAVDHSNPSEGFITDPPKNIPMNGMLFNPMGQEIAKDQAIKGIQQARSDYQSAQAMKVQLDMMKDAYGSLPETGFLSPGPGSNARASIVKAANSALRVAGMTPYFPEEVGSYEELNKLSTRFGFDLARTLGSREAASIVDQAQSAVPSSENTKQGFARIVAGIEAMTQRQSDYYSTMQKWQRSTGGDISGFDDWFNSVNPPAKYARAAVLSTAIMPKSQAEIDNAPAGTVFNINGNLLVK